MLPEKHIVIIGNGIAGVTAARFIRKRSHAAITIISAESRYFFSRTALMYVYMGQMGVKEIQPYEAHFWEKNRINLIQAFVQKVEAGAKLLHLSSGKSLHFDDLVIASGSSYNKFGWPGQNLEGVCGLYSLQDLEYLETNSPGMERAVIVGGGLIGIELAEMLRSRHIEVTMLVRENNYWNNVLPDEEASMVVRHIKEHHIDLRLETELKEIIPDEKGRVKAVVTGSGEKIDCQYVGLTAGVSPNVAFLKDSGIEIDRGVLINEYFETNVPGIYAIGDCAQFRQTLPGRGKLEQVWYTGKMHGETVAYTLTGQRTAYNPGIWFNSAKFLDIEYQIYGQIPPQPEPGIESLYWEHPEGRKSIRINYESETMKVTGFNLMGIRYRHKVCDKWISKGTKLTEVMQNLAAANFDPEFFKRHEAEILAVYNQKYPQNAVKLNSRKSLRQLIFG